MYIAEFDQDWPKYFEHPNKSIKERVAKKIGKILEHPNKRYLKKSSFFVDEIGQHIIIYRVFEEYDTVRFYFVGNHKEYERFYRQEF